MIKAILQKKLAFPLFIFLIALTIELLGNTGRQYFSYQSSFRQNNEFWRLFTGHVTHLGWSHFFLNMAGLFLVWFLYGRAYSPRMWTVIFLFCSVIISLGFYFFDHGLHLYVGLSGVLHGLMAAGLIRAFFMAFQDKNMTVPWEDGLIFVGLWSKIFYEQFIGPVPLTETISGANVVVNAHLYGAISGTIYAGFMAIKPDK